MLFQDLLCDEALKQQLIGMVQEKRISHAQLFLSSPGAHAFAVAIAYAQYLSCENPSESDSCGECSSCLMYEKLTHPDLHLIFPNTTTKTVSKDPDSELLAAPFVSLYWKTTIILTSTTGLPTVKRATSSSPSTIATAPIS